VGPGQIAEGGFKQVRPQSGGKKRKSRTDKSKKVRKGSQKPKLTVRKRKSTQGVRGSVAPPRKKGRKVKSKTRRSRQ